MVVVDPHKSVRVALVLPTEFAYARDVLHGIVAATRMRNLYGQESGSGSSATARPWQFRIFRGIYTTTRFLRRWFRDWRPDGIICQIQEDRMAQFYRDMRRPVVELFERNQRAHFPRILPDDQMTGQLAAEYFVSRGFRNFGFFGDGAMAWVREREAGFRRELERLFHLRAADNQNDFTYWSFEQRGRSVAAAMSKSHRRQSAAMADWLASLPKPACVLAANDLWGFELVQAAREPGLHVPDDVAVLGVDNEELLCEMSHPPLSSIRIGGERMGQAAVALMERLLDGEAVPSDPARVPPLGVVTRQSTDVLAVEDPEVAAALRHIRRHAAEGLSVKQMLEAVAVNRRTLERRFVKVLGHTPLEEIRRVRLERVKELLQTDMPVYEVAKRSGFATAEYLATSFVQSTGMTPREFRHRFAPRGRFQNMPR